jgi:hypothetical protein
MTFRLTREILVAEVMPKGRAVPEDQLQKFGPRSFSSPR